mgnify:CR=1 FL=1
METPKVKKIPFVNYLIKQHKKMGDVMLPSPIAGA